jgi:hypothetical protein
MYIIVCYPYVNVCVVVPPMHTRADRVDVLPIRLRVRECVCAPARLCVLRRMCTRAETCEHSPPAVERVRLGLQAFQSAKTFSADIGAWNIASLTTLSNVCAAFGRRRATAAAAIYLYISV